MLLSQSNIDLPSWSSGSRRRPLTAETRVRFPMGVPNVKTHLNDVFFRFKSSLGNRTGGKTENPMNSAPYSNSAHFINAKEFWRLHLGG